MRPSRKVLEKMAMTTVIQSMFIVDFDLSIEMVVENDRWSFR